MTSLGKIEGPAVMFADGNVCGYVKCSIIVSRTRGFLEGHGRIDGGGAALKTASEAKEVELRLISRESFKIEFHQVYPAEGYASITTSGPLPRF
jgi:hypothetical protein